MRPRVYVLNGPNLNLLGMITGFGVHGYSLAIEHLAFLLQQGRPSGAHE